MVPILDPSPLAVPRSEPTPSIVHSRTLLQRLPRFAAILICTLLVCGARAQDLPPAPPEPAPSQPTNQPPRSEPAPRAEAPASASEKAENASPLSKIKIPDVSDWTAQDAINYAEQNRVIVIGAVAGVVLIFLWIGNLIGPGSTAKLGGRDVKALPAPIWLFGAILAYIATPLAAQFLADLPDLKSGDPLRDKSLIQFGAVGAGSLVGFALLFVMSKTAGGAGLRLKASDLPIGIGCFLLALPFVLLAGDGAVVVYTKLYNEAPPVVAHPTLELIVNNRSSQWAMLLALVAVLLSPLWEEIVWRGFLQSAILRAAAGQPWIAILTTSTLFTLVHRASADPVPWYALAPIFTLGLAMGIAFERTKRLGVPILMHMCFNGLNVGLALAST